MTLREVMRRAQDVRVPPGGIYVETYVRTDLDTLWAHTQDPQAHERWDLRFSRITYLPRPDDRLPQQFLYETRIGPLTVRGTGESTGTRERDGTRTSGLRFFSPQAWSLIREGRGYWRYLPDAQGVRFLTWYDYEPRFGTAGRLFDRAVFRPLIGWATAWSFDTLRLWTERGQRPETSVTLAAASALTRGAVGMTWLWHGLVPKLLTRSDSETQLLLASGVPAAFVPAALITAGAAEVLLGAATLLSPRRWPLKVTLLLMPLALLSAALADPRVLTGAFTPVTLNLCVMALAGAALLLESLIPRASRCARRPPEIP